MKIKSKGTLLNGYRRIFLGEYGGKRFLEFQFNIALNGIGVGWYISPYVKHINLNLIFISITLSF